MERRKNFFDKIGSLIPGYAGYAEREGRRNTDKIFRESLSKTILEIERVMYVKIDEALKTENFILAKDLDCFRKELNTFSFKIKFSPYGESGFFSDNQLKEEELLVIYQMDVELSEEINNLFKSVIQEDYFAFSKLLEKNKGILDNRNKFISEFK